MGMCHSLRSRLIGPQSAITYTGRTGGSAGGDGETGQPDYTTDPQLRDRLRVEEKARIKAENKRSRNIDKSLKAEKREYKQTHRLLLLVKKAVHKQEARNLKRLEKFYLEVWLKSLAEEPEEQS